MASLSIEEENYVRISLLLTGVSPRAVRCLFDKDKDLAPAALPATVQRENQKLLWLKGKKIINGAQWNILHPANGIPDSNNFDVTLMICLLRNLKKITPPTYGFDCLPPPGETTEGADLARIKYYRNVLAHLDDTKMATPKFITAWNNVADAVGRLGGQHMMQECQELKLKSLDQSNKEIMIEIKQSQEEIKNLKQSHEGLKRSHDILQAEMKKEVKKHKASHRKLKESYVCLQKDHEDRQKEIDNLKEARDDPVPWNIREQINKKMETWKKDDQIFVETRASTRVLKCVKTESCVTVTGSSGMGKTFTVRHVALQMAEHGYDILPVTSPKDIEKYYNPKKNTMFVIDNFCGTYTLNQNVLDKWKSLSDTITDILKDKVTKIIASCRSQVYQDELFKSFSVFTSCECNLMSKELRLLDSERQSLSELYLKTEASKVREYLHLFDCFPLLCKWYSENQNFDVTEFFKNPFSVYEKEVRTLCTERAYGKYCALALCVMFNNHLMEEWLTKDIDKDMRTVIENTCEACKLERGTSRLVIRDELESLNNTFIKKDTEVKSIHVSLSAGDPQIKMEWTKFKKGEERNYYCTIHDKLFDYLVSYFGAVMITTIIKYGASKLISERFVFEKQDDSDQFTVIVPDKNQQMYLQRMIDDWVKGHVSHVFSNINMKKQKFRDILMKFLTNLEPSFQKKLAEMCEVTYDIRDVSYKIGHPFKYFISTTPLICCSLVGDNNMVQWFCDHGSDVNHCNSNVESPLYMACRMGHTEVVNVLINNKAEVNRCTKLRESPLYIACKRGYTEIVTKLLDNKADVNQCIERGGTALHVACEGGYTEIVTKLLDNKANVNQCTEWAGSALYIACERGYTEIVTKLLDNKADVNQCTEWGELPLYIACQEGYTEIVTKLLDNKADVNQCTQWGGSALYVACEGGYTEIVTKLLDNKADVNQCTKWGGPPLHVACEEGYTEIVTKLLDNKADVNQCTEEGVPSLYEACFKGYTEIVTKLLDNKADVNQCTKCGESPLYIACEGGYTEIVTKLLDNKAKVNQCAKSGESPLYIACEGGYTEIVTKLLDNKADVNQCTERGGTALYVACEGGYTEIVTKILDNKADVNQCTKWGGSALYVACEGGYTEIVTKLLDNKADVNQCTKWGGPPLHGASEEGYTEIVTELLDNKAYFNQCTEFGKSPLYGACEKGHTEIVTKLLDNKADVNQCTELGKSPLYGASERGYNEIVTKLLDNKADVNQCTELGKSPLYRACEEGYTEIVTKLLDNKADFNQCTEFGKSPLYGACEEGHTEIVTKLLDNKADVNQCRVGRITSI